MVIQCHSMTIAPDFTLIDQFGKEQSLLSFRGKWVVLYFYPKDNTPGCTTEACSFRDYFGELTKHGIVVLGVSKDSVASHQKFASKHNLPFLLLSDPDHRVIEQYSAWGEKKFMGKLFLGILRMTYLINPAGEIAKVYPKVNPSDHIAEILQDFAQLNHN